jgi:hypothetical protein
MTNNLFPLPYWAPALQRVPKPLQVLNEAYLRGERVPLKTWMAGPSPAEAISCTPSHKASARVGGTSPAMTGWSLGPWFETWTSSAPHHEDPTPSP